MAMPLRVLILENQPADAELVVNELRRAEFEPVWERVETEPDYLAHLDLSLDLILAGDGLPQFDGLRALRLLQERKLDIPLIVITARIDEDRAISMMKQGAADYLRQDRLAHLGPAVARALKDKKLHEEKQCADQAWRESEPQVRSIVENSTEGIVITDEHERILRDITDRKQTEEKLRESRERFSVFMDNLPAAAFIKDEESRILYVNQYMKDAFGSEDWIGKTAHDLFPEAAAEIMVADDKQVLVAGPLVRVESLVDRQGVERVLQTIKFPIPRDGKPTLLGGFSIDITERKRAEKTIQRQVERIAVLRAIDMAISSSLDLHASLNVILDQITTQLRVNAAAVLLLDPSTQTLDYAASRGFMTDALQHTHLQLGGGSAGRVALAGRTIAIPNLVAEPGEFARSRRLAAERFVAYYGVPLIVKGQVTGVLELFHRAPLDPDSEWLDFLETLAVQTAIAIDHISLIGNLRRSNVELAQAYDATIEGWSRALDLRDRGTEGHTQRVTELTLRLARVMGVDEQELVHMRRGAILHDMGKMGIPDSILLKPGPLTPQEWELMRKHPVYAYEMLSPITFLEKALDIPYCHHEKWDGTGYPRGLKGEEIPLTARIFAVVDVWDALRSDRPYGPAVPEEEVLKRIRALAGTHFDPQVAEAFLSMIGEK